MTRIKSILLVYVLLSQSAFAQVVDYKREYNKINENLMLTLGSYAVGNFAVSGACYFASEDEYFKRFHEMNVIWNTVNFGLALPGYSKAKRNAGDWDAAEMQRQQQKTQSIFLINTALDIGYIATGIYLRGEAENRPDESDMFCGYGDSMVLQGSFLFLFDLVAYTIHKRHYNREENTFLNNVSIHSFGQGIGLIVQLD
tara:strand:- start:8318 stop:8914 length:597 start_codon:yes stop_codon:yes gene_type:complete